MIDFNEMINRQKEGQALLTSLQDDERMVLQHYCSLETDELLKMGAQVSAPIDQIIINAMRHGISIGLTLRIENGEIK